MLTGASKVHAAFIFMADSAFLLNVAKRHQPTWRHIPEDNIYQ
jgi:hypothetical protein